MPIYVYKFIRKIARLFVGSYRLAQIPLSIDKYTHYLHSADSGLIKNKYLLLLICVD